MNETPLPGTLLESLARQLKTSYERCLHLDMECNQPPIRAHSIQNAAHLDLLERAGHVVQLTRRLERTGPTIHFEEVGRNRATTFLGLCSEHDNALFKPIESSPINSDNQEHLFLLAYRAVHRALYTEINSSLGVQRAYSERRGKELNPPSEITPLGLYATQLLIQSYEAFLYKQQCDAIYASSRWESFSHDVRILKCQAPSLAVSGFFSPNYDARDRANVCFSVFPATRSETVIVLSYLTREARAARRHFRSLLKAKGSRLAYEVSRVVLNSCENFVLAPAIFDVWPAHKRNAILNYFRRTLFVNDWTVENPALNLLLAA